MGPRLESMGMRMGPQLSRLGQCGRSPFLISGEGEGVEIAVFVTESWLSLWG